MAYKALPTQERLKELFDYNPETGIFTRLTDVGRRYKAGSIAGTINKNGYTDISVDKKRYKAHRLAWIYYHGTDPKELFIDHINGDTINNSITNLRLSTNQQNVFNKKCVGNIPYKGVSYSKGRNRYVAQIKINGKTKCLGYFHTPEEAHKVYRDAAKRLHGEFFYTG